METQKWNVMAGVAAGAFLTSLDASVVNLALPTLMQSFDVSLSNIEWVLTAYLLTVTGFLLITGRIADLWGLRRVFVAGIGMIMAGSAGCAITSDFRFLIAARVVQAIGASAVLATGPALVTNSFPPHQRGRALGIIATFGAAGLTAGLPLGGYLLRQYEWPAIFWVNIPAAFAIAAWALLRFPADIPSTRRRTFDLQGATLLFASLSSFLLAANMAPSTGWLELEPLALIFAAVILFLWFQRVEAETQEPIIETALWQNGRFAGASIAALLNFIMLFGASFLLPFYFIHLKSDTAQTAALFLMIMPAVVLFVSPIAGVLSDRNGTRGICVVGLLLTSAGLLLLGELDANTAPWDVAWRLALTGLGAALFQSPNNSALMGSVPPQRLGIAAALLSTARNAGMVLGIALAAAVFNARFGAETGHGLEGFTRDDVAAFEVSMQLALHIAAALGAPAVLASLMKSRGQTQEPPTLF